MFFLDSLMISGLSWTLETVAAAAEAEMNDDTALRAQLLAAEMQRENGEISDADYAALERELMVRIGEIRERRTGGSGPIAFGDPETIASTGEGRVTVEAVVSGDFHESASAPHTTIVEIEPARRGIVGTQSGSTAAVLDVTPVRARTIDSPALPLPASRARKTGSQRKSAARKTTRKPRGPRSARTRSVRSRIRRS